MQNGWNSEKYRSAVENPEDGAECERLASTTPARICAGRAGCRYRTGSLLTLRVDHAAAADAVKKTVDEALMRNLGFYTVQTLVKNKEEYLTRPDLGRRFSEETLKLIQRDCINGPDVQIVIADGLSANAIEKNIEEIYPVILDGLKFKGYSVGTSIFVKYARVAVMDRISEALQAKVTVLLVGERPGLATADSMGCYMGFEASTQKPESQRTVISNIHADGTPPVEAGAQIVSLVEIMRKERKSGVELRL